MKLGSTRSGRPGKARFLAVLLLAFAIAFAAWYVFRVGPVPEVNLVTERPAVGKSNGVTAEFSEPKLGLGTIRLELIQGDRTELLAQEVFVPGSGIPFVGSTGTAQAVFDATVATDAMGWLAHVCRVDPGGFPPGPPTDPDVGDYRIRLLEMRLRY